MVKSDTSKTPDSGGTPILRNEDKNSKEPYNYLKEIRTSSSTVHRINIKLPIVVRKSNSRTFARIKPIDRNIGKVLPSVLASRQQKICLSFVKITLEVVRVLNSTESRLTSVLCALRKSEITSLGVNNALQELQKTCVDIKSDLDNFQNTYRDLYKSELFRHVITFLKSRLTARNVLDSCRKIVKYLQVFTGKLVELMVSGEKVELSFVSVLSLCSITASRIEDFVSCPFICYSVDFEFRVERSFHPSEQQKQNSIRKHTFDLTWFLKETGKLKSFKLSINLSTATLNAINKSNISRKELLQTPLAPNRTRTTVRALKHIYKKILEDENSFFADLIQNIQIVNTETLSKNTEVLYRTCSKTLLSRGGSPSMRRFVQWDSNLGPSHQDYLFSIYMDSLWTNVQKHIVIDYMDSIYGDVECMCRMSQPSLISFEQELIWQINLKLKRNGSSPQTFLDTLTFLSVSAKGFWNQQIFFRGLHKSMSTVIKDRFRRIDCNITSPSTATFKDLMDCHTCFHELLSILQKYKFFNNQERASTYLLVYSVLNPLVVFYQYLRWLLIRKRHQFLISATWEQYLTISTSEVKFGFLSCKRILTSLKNVFKNDDTKEIGLLEELLHFLEIFEKSSLKLMVSQLGQRSRAAWRNHMANKKIWKRRGNRHQVYQASSYINVVMQLIFGPLFESVEILSRNQKLELISKSTSIFVKAWMDHILSERIIFSWYGAQQLNFDFNHFVTWFESEELGLSLEEISEIHSLPVIANMRSAVVLLACQPDSQKKRDDLSLLINKHGGSSASTISQVSMESVAGAQFDEIVKSIELHDKERWLALRAKGGQAKRFLCMT